MTKIGISKHRLMSGGSKWCTVCSVPLGDADGKHFPANHLCPEHLDWEMVVTDSQTSPVLDSSGNRRVLGEIWDITE